MARTALVVDDSTTMQEMVSFTLSKAGFDVTRASNGQEALTRANGQKFDLVHRPEHARDGWAHAH
ncbi:MAG: hypothetical protein ABTQ32_06865 [Myxococcaceae bacterium]